LIKNKLLTKVFSSGLQAIAIQVLGGVFFYFISIYISKEDFGIISWTNAASVFLTTFLGFGMEQVVIRRIAASDRSDWAAAAFFAHSITGFLITFLLLLLLSGWDKSGPGIYKILPWFFLAQGLIYIATPLKQFLNAKERFTPYGIIAVISNLAKLVAAWFLMTENRLHIHTIVVVVICTAAFELGCLLIYMTTRTTFSFKFQSRAYVKLLKESTSQYISVIFDTSLSRMDWILLGMMTSSIVLADYSFAYRAYELARLPILIIAPIILPRLARLMALTPQPDQIKQQQINAFNAVEMFLSLLIPLTLNILWTPLLTLITNGKYGEANALQFLILSLCIPLQFFINLLWSLSFSAKKYKSVSYITISCAVINIVLNLVLISKFKGLGAAAAFFTTTLIQACLYYNLVRKEIMVISLRPVIVFTVAAAIIYFITIRINVHFLIQLAIAVVLYILTALCSKQITRQQLHNFKNFLSL
jgi:O-antigen/teichoic acid export membrane protein